MICDPLSERLKKPLTTVVLLSTLFGGCASSVPEQIRSAPAGDPGLEDVRAEIQQFAGAAVRWGGEIASVENFASHTQVEVVARALTNSGRPKSHVQSSGRFLGNVPGFLDPVIYKVKREITVLGTVAGSKTKTIGEYPYRYPVIEVSDHVLWQPLPQYDPHSHRYLYDPWYDPWYRHRYWHYPYRYR